MKRRWMIWCSVWAVFLSVRGWGQPAEFAFSKDEDLPDFYYDVVTSASDESGKTILNLYTKITYDELQFVREGNQYKAKYELSVTVFNKKGEQTDSRIIERELTVGNYSDTNSRKVFSTAEVMFLLKPGKYDLLIGVMDSDSKKTGRRKTTLDVPAYDPDAFGLSDIFFFDRMEMDSTGHTQYLPNVQANYAELQDSLFFSFSVYNGETGQPLRIAWAVMDMAGGTLRKDEMKKPYDPQGEPIVIKLPKGDLKSGKYRLSLSVESGKLKTKKMKDFSIRWTGMPVYTTDLDDAINQLRYIAKGGDIRKMKKAKGEEKQRMFNEFWLAMDPTPGTDQNELMEEYYRRVDFSNSNFRGLRDGWLTDRGMVYIILGPPDNIERYPFEANSKPYEIWSFYRLNRDFIFVDETGFGDYRLVTPFWEILERLQ